ncbi:protein of unknown function [Xenorhabdus poinarii G6]|uniref:Uncharacterized protein n=1 Tax=Xenorhabdus poinarii G6 TaxID=1354304 RepID=A0A068R9B9_9GAMM|nr:protein of unknown function [Xenorhabdus poinarii G6]
MKLVTAILIVLQKNENIKLTLYGHNQKTSLLRVNIHINTPKVSKLFIK